MIVRKHSCQRVKCCIGRGDRKQYGKDPLQTDPQQAKTLGLELWPEGLNVWVSLRATNRQIEYFVEQHRQWILQHQEELERQKADFPL